MKIIKKGTPQIKRELIFSGSCGVCGCEVEFMQTEKIEKGYIDAARRMRRDVYCPTENCRDLDLGSKSKIYAVGSWRDVKEPLIKKGDIGQLIKGNKS